ncbi:MAG: ATP synthase F1 subunit delta, partial [Deltaproteobacteria bacterium]|nr:ATP synthase F1 subunit delta [Deltaproteobacteria bacterium]
FSLSQREELLHRVAGRLSLSPLLSLFLKHLLQKKHLSYLGNICDSYQIHAETMLQKRRGVVISAISLSQDQKEEIYSQLQRASRQKLLLNFQVNPEVLGGMRIQIGSLRFDNTIAQQLETIRGHLLAQATDVVQSMVKPS